MGLEMGPEPYACPVRFLLHALNVPDRPVLIQQESGPVDGQGFEKAGRMGHRVSSMGFASGFLGIMRS
jgi:hypothetical protein